MLSRRVIQPPEDQRQYARLGAFYFALCDDDVKLVPFSDSPVLARVGARRRFEDMDAPTMESWRKGRTAAYGQSKLKATASGVEEEVINGVVVKHFN